MRRSEAVDVAGADDVPQVQPSREVVLLLVDPDARVRRRAAIERAGFSVVVPRPLLEWVARRRSGVLLVADDDVRTDQVRAAVRRAAPDAACVVLVDQPSTARYRELLPTCTAVLPASAGDEELGLAVQAAWRALSCLPADAVRALTAQEEDEVPDLAARERGWLRALADGATVAGLARSSGYSQREMYRQLAATYARLGAATRTDALLRADRLGLLGDGLRTGRGRS